MKYIELSTSKKSSHLSGVGGKPCNAVVGLDLPDPEPVGRKDSPHGRAKWRTRNDQARCHGRFHAELRDRFRT